MRTGDTVRDGQGNTWVLGPPLGRGLWGRAWTVRRQDDDATFVLKTVLGPEDLPADTPDAAGLLAASREAVLEQARLLAEAGRPYLPALEARLTVEDQPAYVIPRLSDTLERRLIEGLPLATVIEVLVAAAQAVGRTDPGAAVHGALRPTNVGFDDAGRLVLTDPLTPAVARNLKRFAAAAPPLVPWYPPEVVEGSPVGVGTDTWALAMMLWRGAVTGGPVPNPPRAGLDKAAQVTLKDRLLDRLKNEDANPRFHARLAERVAVLLARGLAREAAPSPPYRFPRLDELVARLQEVGGLVRPCVDQVGKILLDRPATRPWFGTDEVVTFSCTVGATAGVDGAEEIGVGIAVFDLDQDVRLKELDLGYSCDRHPSGRYRFGFKINGLGPGRYKVRVAFAVRDSGHPPATAESDFTVVAAPGWVPRAAPAAPATLPFRAEEPPTGITQVAPAPEPRMEARAVPPAARGVEPARSFVNGRGAPIASPTPPVPAERPAAERPAAARPVTERPVVERPLAERAEVEAPAPAPVARTLPPPPLSVPLPAPVPAAPAEVEVTDVLDDRPPRVPPRGPPVASPGAPPAALRDAPAPRVARPVAPVEREAPPPPAAPIASPVVPVVAAPAPEEDIEPPRVAPRFSTWADEPLPSAPDRDLDAEADLDPEEPPEPGPLSRVIDQLRNDPYLAVMAGLGLLTLVLLVVFLSIRE